MQKRPKSLLSESPLRHALVAVDLCCGLPACTLHCMTWRCTAGDRSWPLLDRITMEGYHDAILPIQIQHAPPSGYGTVVLSLKLQLVDCCMELVGINQGEAQYASQRQSSAKVHAEEMRTIFGQGGCKTRIYSWLRCRNGQSRKTCTASRYPRPGRTVLHHRKDAQQPGYRKSDFHSSICSCRRFFFEGASSRSIGHRCRGSSPPPCLFRPFDPARIGEHSRGVPASTSSKRHAMCFASCRSEGTLSSKAVPRKLRTSIQTAGDAFVV